MTATEFYGGHVTSRDTDPLLLDPLLTIDQVAEICNVSKRLVQNWIYAGDLAALRLGGKTVRIRRSAVDDFLDKPYNPQEVKEARRRAQA